MRARYWLKLGSSPWRKVSVEEFIEAERSAGFHPKPGCGPVATGGFTATKGEFKIQGRVTYGQITKEKYSWDPEFLRVAMAIKSAKKVAGKKISKNREKK